MKKLLSAFVLILSLAGIGLSVLQPSNAATVTIDTYRYGASAEVIPLRTVATQNRVYTARESRGNTRHHQTFYWPMYLATDVSEFVINTNNWYLNTSGLQNTGNSITIEQMSLVAPNGTAAPAYFSGVRSKTLASGDTDVNTDPILPSAFGYSQGTAGDTYYIKGIVSIANNADFIPMTLSSALSTTDFGTAQIRWYDNTVITPSSTDTSGAYTFSGGTPETRGTGFRPMLLGRPLVDGLSVIGIGDSIIHYANDDATAGIHGRGMLQRAAGNMSFGLINFALFGSQTTIVTGSTAWKPYLKYATVLYEEYGTNNFGVGHQSVATVVAAVQSIWTTAKTENPDIQIVRPKLLPRTGSTDNWTTEAGQTSYLTYWDVGGRADQFNTEMDNQLSLGNVDFVVGMTSVRDSSFPNKWKTDGVTAKLYADDGTHPSPNGHAEIAEDEIEPVLSTITFAAAAANDNYQFAEYYQKYK